MDTFLLIGIGLAIIVIVAQKISNDSKKRDDTGTSSESTAYRSLGKLMSPAELAFWKVLCQSVPASIQIFAKVRMCDLVKGEGQSAFNRIKAKHVDFVICAKSDCAILGVIELDDSSHHASSRAERDDFVDKVMQGAGIPILHVKAKAGYNSRELAAEVEGILSRK
jgi:very-short-patch-repair endonuclease